MLNDRNTNPGVVGRTRREDAGKTEFAKLKVRTSPIRSAGGDRLCGNMMPGSMAFSSFQRHLGADRRAGVAAQGDDLAGVQQNSVDGQSEIHQPGPD